MRMLPDSLQSIDICAWLILWEMIKWSPPALLYEASEIFARSCLILFIKFAILQFVGIEMKRTSSDWWQTEEKNLNVLVSFIHQVRNPSVCGC